MYSVGSPDLGPWDSGWNYPTSDGSPACAQQTVGLLSLYNSMTQVCIINLHLSLYLIGSVSLESPNTLSELFSQKAAGTPDLPQGLLEHFKFNGKHIGRPFAAHEALEAGLTLV